MTCETPVTFQNRDGMTLFGIVHEPDPNAAISDTAIILLSPGVKMRVAPHRLYNVMAKRFCEEGFRVFRFDFHGLGDSEGDRPEKFLADLYGHVQVGCYIDDTIAAMDWMESRYGVRKFVLGGLCGGAITGLLTAPRDERVAGLLALGIPVILDSTAIDQSRYITAGQMGRLREGYLKRLMSPGAWLRLLSFRSDFRLILKVFGAILPKRRDANHDTAPTVDRESSAASQSADNFNPHFPRAFFHMMESGRPILLLFSGADRLHWEFEEKFAQPFRERLQQYRHGYTLDVIQNANHILSSSESKQAMLEAACGWLGSEFGERRIRRSPATSDYESVG